MTKISSILAVCATGLLLAGCQTAGSHLTKAEQAASAKLAKSVPIADLHDHDGYAKFKGKETGVVWAGLGAKRGDRSDWIPLKKELGDKRIAWAGQGEFNSVFLSGGMKEMLNPDNPTLVRLYKEAEQDLKDGVIVGLGEIFVNNRTTQRNKRFRRKGQVDAPLIRKFFDLVAKYDGFMAFHMQAESDSLEQLDKLLASNRKGRVVWNHCGSDTSASDVRSLMDKHPNLFCELSQRYPPVQKNRSRQFFNSGGIESDWRQLIEDHADRFMVGTDAHSIEEFVGAIETVRKGLLPDLKPATARNIAYQNAQRLFKLKDIPGS
jgi:hypothetical protein|tara:strand:+ start:246 stop:1208 length:963 start_codon:yes stop_codon:yes gene_type:complete